MATKLVILILLLLASYIGYAIIGIMYHHAYLYSPAVLKLIVTVGITPGSPGCRIGTRDMHASHAYPQGQS